VVLIGGDSSLESAKEVVSVDCWSGRLCLRREPGVQNVEFLVALRFGEQRRVLVCLDAGEELTERCGEVERATVNLFAGLPGHVVVEAGAVGVFAGGRD
jgi:hypothetical protein